MGGHDQNKILSLDYHGVVFAFFRSFGNASLFTGFWEKDKLCYLKELCEEFELLVSQQNNLPSDYWKTLCTRLYDLPNSLTSLSDNQKKEVYQKFNDIIKQYGITM